MKPKILVLTPSLGTGGAERVACNLANNLHARGYLVSLAVLRLNKHSYKVTEGIDVIPLCKGKPTQNPFSRISFALRTFVKFFSVLVKERPQIVISHTTNANAWTAFLCILLRIPYVLSEHTTPDRTLYTLNRASRRLYYELYKRSEALVVPSAGIMQQLKKSSLFEQLRNVKIIHNPISEFKSLSSGRVHPRPFILSVGRLHQVKGFDRLIQAFSEVSNSDIDLVIVGEGKERDALTRLIEQHGLAHRIFLPGAKSNVQDYYKQCQLYVLASRNEGYPVGLIEAMSFGCACVAFDCDFGPREIIEHGKNGLLIPNGEITLLRQAIETLLDDQVLKSRVSENAKAVAHTNSTSYITTKWEELISCT